MVQGSVLVAVLTAAVASAEVLNSTEVLLQAKDFAFYQGGGGRKTTKVSLGGLTGNVWYPSDAKKGEELPVFLYVAGSVTSTSSYSNTLSRLASHGVVGSTCTAGNVVKIIDDFADPSEKNLPSALKGKISHDMLAVGGHSGGGPCALKAAGRRSSVIKAVVPQHSAAIPGINKLSNSEIKAIKGKSLVLCGTSDSMPFCGCSPYAERDIHKRLGAPSVLVKVKGASHVTGVEGSSGDKQEGGYIVAFLSYMLKGDADGRGAVLSGRPAKGDEIDDRGI